MAKVVGVILVPLHQIHQDPMVPLHQNNQQLAYNFCSSKTLFFFKLQTLFLKKNPPKIDELQNDCTLLMWNFMCSGSS